MVDGTNQSDMPREGRQHRSHEDYQDNKIPAQNDVDSENNVKDLILRHRGSYLCTKNS